MWELEGVRQESGIDIAFKSGEDIGAEVLQVGSCLVQYRKR